MDYNANIPAKYSDQNPKPSSNELLNQEKQLLGGKILMFVFFIAVITTLAVSFCRIYAICLYRRTQRNPASSRRRRSTGETSSDPSPISIISGGLKPDILNSIPTFVFSAKNYENGMECSVCLSKFVDNERGRSLPNCKHYFHLDCIDMWFRSHDTCPLCRTTVNLTELTNLEMVSSQFSSPSSSKASSSNLSKDSWCIRVDNEGSEINNDSKSTPPV